MKTRLAWKNLTHKRRRLALAVLGIGFAVVLMCMQLSFKNALFDSMVQLIRRLDADLIITSGAKYTIVVRETFKRQRLFQARACPDVVSAVPLYIETQLSLVDTAEGGVPIRVLAFDPADQVLRLPELRPHLDELRLVDKALFDDRSKSVYGVSGRPGEALDLADGEVDIVGRFELGTDFANDGNLIVGDSTYLDLFPLRASGDDGLADVDLGLVKLRPGADAAEVLAVKQRLSGMLPGDVNVYSKQEFEDQERSFWATATPIGIILGAGTFIGFIVGIVICYQILSADIADHLAEFATLKAMGYPSRYFRMLVLEESLYLSVLGFLPGLAASAIICQFVAWGTGLPIHVAPLTAAIVLAFSVAMCVLSGRVAIRKVMSADPAELFK